MPIIAIILTGLKFTVNIPTHLLADELVFFLDDSNSVHKRRKAALLNKQVRLLLVVRTVMLKQGKRIKLAG